MIKLSQIIILNVPKREREGKYLKKLIETSAKPFGIEVSISMDRGLGLWDNYSRALTQDVAEGTHRMVVHDDISFDRNILEKILYILSYAPEHNVVSFYNPLMAIIQTVSLRVSMLYLQKRTFGFLQVSIRMT